MEVYLKNHYEMLIESDVNLPRDNDSGSLFFLMLGIIIALMNKLKNEGMLYLILTISKLEKEAKAKGVNRRAIFQSICHNIHEFIWPAIIPYII